MGKLIKFLKLIFFSPLAYLWESIYKVRRNFYTYGFFKSYFFEVPIISVGNITFGGTGKTPFTIWLTEFVESKFYRPLILTRGYKGKYEHGAGLIEAKKSFSYNPVDFGDEPLLIARRLKQGGVVVGKKRAANLTHFFQKIQPDVVLLDDGFQHLQLNRNCNIVLFDALLPLERYQVAPNGYLREGMTALKDAQAIVVSRADQVSQAKIEGLKQLVKPHLKKDIPWAMIQYQPSGVYNSNYKKVMEVTELKGQKVIAAAAIASPQSFFKGLEELGAEIVDKKVYPDHYYFDLSDINELLVQAAASGAIVVMSEKDIVKIRKISTEVKIYYIEIMVDFISGQKELENLIESTIKVHN